MNTLDRLLSLAEKQIRLVMLELKQPLLPTWVLISPKQHIDVKCTPWADELEKRLAKHYLKNLMRMRKTVAYSFITEAWMAQAPKGWNPDTDAPVHAVDQPDKQEVALAFACNARECRWKRWSIKRDWLEQIIDLEELPGPDDNPQLEGWMTEMLQ